jgi:hypothetical protein
MNSAARPAPGFANPWKLPPRNNARCPGRRLVAEGVEVPALQTQEDPVAELVAGGRGQAKASYCWTVATAAEIGPSSKSSSDNSPYAGIDKSMAVIPSTHGGFQGYRPDSQDSCAGLMHVESAISLW